MGQGGDGDLGPTTCLLNHLSTYDFTIDEDVDIPLIGEAFFYVFLFCEVPPCSYGQTSLGNERVLQGGVSCP